MENRWLFVNVKKAPAHPTAHSILRT